MFNEKKIKAGVFGAAGYTGGELIRLLVNHPMIASMSLQSRSHAGEKVYEAHPDLLSQPQLVFTEELAINELDLIFVCSGHGQTKLLLDEYPEMIHKRVIDLSQDFRCDSTWTYGLTELYKEQIKQATHVSNPGCFATCIQLALLPAVENTLIESAVSINAITGSTGAGQKAQATTHFSWRNDNISAYKAFNHQHEKEIYFHLEKANKNQNINLHWIPLRGGFTRGIFASSHFTSQASIELIQEVYQSRYENHPFCFYSEADLDLKQVVNTNNCFISVRKYKDQVHVISIIDNLLKGASGQAVENMNLMFNYPQQAGLQLKATSF